MRQKPSALCHVPAARRESCNIGPQEMRTSTFGCCADMLAIEHHISSPPICHTPEKYHRIDDMEGQRRSGMFFYRESASQKVSSARTLLPMVTVKDVTMNMAADYARSKHYVSADA